MKYFCTYDSPIGKLLLASDGNSLTGLWTEGAKYIRPLTPHSVFSPELPIFQETQRWLSEYFSGNVPDFIPSVAPHGTLFQRTVWNILLTVPYGSVTTYGSIAKQIAQMFGKLRMSAQAVGNAVSRNPVSIIIPCHRVIGKNGDLTGYAGGIDKKQFLLNHEKQ